MRELHDLGLRLICLAVLFGPTFALAQVRSLPDSASAVPAWNARGSGPLPWQGIACIDLSADARWIAVGTISPFGDPNVFLLDGQGELVRTTRAGQRWLQQVAVDRSGQF